VPEQNLPTGWPVVRPPADIDVTTAGQLEVDLVSAASEGPTVVVDMSQTQFCDSTGISVLNQARERAEADGGQLRLVITSASVLRIFAVTGIDQLFPIFTSLPDALAVGPAPPDGPGPGGRNSPQARRLKAGAQVPRREQAKAPRSAPPADTTRRSRQDSLHAALEAARRENQIQAQRLEEAGVHLQAITEWIETGRAQRAVLRESGFARLQAQLESLPVIEQAKGILMAQHRCGPGEAFDLLRRASQRANVKVHMLATQIVAQAASPPADTRARRSQPAASRRA
jgi:anti-sigma B factor antagonist